jgi:hypothetical protein
MPKGVLSWENVPVSSLVQVEASGMVKERKTTESDGDQGIRRYVSVMVKISSRLCCPGRQLGRRHCLLPAPLGCCPEGCRASAPS